MSASDWLFFLLLLIAGFCGWAFARMRDWRFTRHQKARNPFTRDYFVGLNYLLHDEPDEAVDTFINALELNSETVETHLALGILLRRRGKVDRAIEVHQNLLSRSGLPAMHVDSIRLELARDFCAAGVLDRAEKLLREIVGEGRDLKCEALSQLIVISQMSKEWGHAEAAARELLAYPRYRRQADLRTAASHFCCELAQESVRNADIIRARRWLARAWRYDRSNVRPALIRADLETDMGNHRKAARTLMRAIRRYPQWLVELMPALVKRLTATGSVVELETILQDARQHRSGTTVMLQSVALQSDSSRARQMLAGGQERHATLRGLAALAGLMSETDDLAVIKVTAGTIQRALTGITKALPVYHCESCGFEARKLHWQCPSCQQWGVVRPIIGPLGD